MSELGQKTTIGYLEQRLGELYGPEKAARITEHIKLKTAQICEDKEMPMQNSVNKLIYPFLSGMEALGVEGIPAEDASPILMKMWEEMPEEIKVSGLNMMCDDDGE